MAVFRFDIALDTAHGKKAFLRVEGGVERVAVTGRQPSSLPELRGQAKIGPEAAPGTTGRNRKSREVPRTAGASGQAFSAENGQGEPPREGKLPDFVIIGAQKCGTSSLYHLLRQHPDVEPSRRKEIHYFDVNFDRGIGWYKAHFPSGLREDGRGTISGESSPYYLFHPHAPKRMAAAVPGAKLIVLLRNPVDRAYSHYQAAARQRRESLGFEAALGVEKERLQGEREKMVADESYVSLEHQHFSYLTRGIYVDQISRWLEFFPEDQMLVMKSEDFFERPWETLNETLNFLELLEWRPETWKVRNKGDYKERMDPATRRQLEEYFRPHNLRLYEHLGVDFGW